MSKEVCKSLLYRKIIKNSVNAIKYNFVNIMCSKHNYINVYSSLLVFVYFDVINFVF